MREKKSTEWTIVSKQVESARKMEEANSRLFGTAAIGKKGRCCGKIGRGGRGVLYGTRNGEELRVVFKVVDCCHRFKKEKNE